MQHLRAPVAPGAFLGGGPTREHRGDEAEGETGDVGEHVRGVGQESEAAGDDGADDLDDEDGDGDAEDGAQPAAMVDQPVRAVSVVGAHQRLGASP